MMILLKLSQDEQTLIFFLIQNNRSGRDIFTRDLPAGEQLVSSML